MDIVSLILLIVGLIIGLILLIVFLYYLLGNVYSGLIKRKKRVEHSYLELCKSAEKLFEFIPSIIQNVDLNEEEIQMLQEIYKGFKIKPIERYSPSELCLMNGNYMYIFNKLLKKFPNDDTLNFIQESRRLMKFSIPLYNSNVKDFNSFKHMLINNFIAKALHLEDAEEFVNPKVHGDTTIIFEIDK